MKVFSLVPFLAVVVGLCGMSAPLRAAAPSGDASFSSAQRAAIVQIMRQALLTDPTILTDAISSLRAQAEQQAASQTRDAVKAQWSALRSAPDFAIRGNPEGTVTVIEFLDPRCSYCRHMAPLVDQFLARHHDVRLVEKLVPVLGAGSVIDTRAIVAASAQGKYDVMRRALMADTAPASMDRVREVARANGLDMSRFGADMSAPATVGLITANLDQARAIGLDGTPTFLFGTAAVAPGALTADQMDAFLGQARKS